MQNNLYGKYKELIFIQILICLFPFFASKISAQTNPNLKYQIYQISNSDSLISTGDKFIINFSDIITLDYKIKLRPQDDYSLNYRNGELKLDKNLFKKYSLDTNRIYDLTVEYDLFPVNLSDEYSNFEIVTTRDTITGDTIEIATQRTDFVSNIFSGTQLEKSGSIFRGFTFGSNRDLSLNSGFRLQLNGKVTDDIEITAALTDENTPIQPEGNTQKLQELDKVFIELRSNNISTTIGDIELNFDNSEFLRFQRKIQGAKGFGEFDFGELSLSGAVQRGKFNSNSFNGIDGIQGPYKLTGSENELNILVLSGTEKVYLDGQLQTRGENEDYVIDYGIGSITFKNRRIITSNSRIVVDFEYSDRRYSRTLLAGKNSLKLFDNKLKFSAAYVSDFDDQDRTIDFTLSEEDKIILANAGDDKFKALKTGIQFVGLDTTTNIGNGSYIFYLDSINTQDTIYKFQPGTDSSVYNVTFSFVGQGKGDYFQISSLEYNYVGKGNGNYLPVIFIPIPTAYQIINAGFEFNPNRESDLIIKLESAYSYLNANKFSNITSSKFGGVAFAGSVNFIKPVLNIAGIDMNNFRLLFKSRLVNKYFTSLERINSVEFNRNFDVSDSTIQTELFNEGVLNFSPGKLFNINYNLGQLKRGEIFNSLRNIAEIGFTGDSLHLPSVKYKFDLLNSDNTLNGISGKWLKHFATVNYKKAFGENIYESPFLETSFNYISETKENRLNGLQLDSFQTSSFAFNEYIPRIAIRNFNNLDFFAEFNYRKDQFVSSGFLTDFSNTYIQKYGLIYRGIQFITASLDLGFRDKQFSETAILQGNTDNKSVLVNSQIRIDPLVSGFVTDLFYNVSSDRTAKIERVFVKVPVGEGNYIYLGDINNNGILDEFDFQLVNFGGDYIRLNIPTNEFFPTVDLRTSAKITLRPSRFINLKNGNIINDVINNLTAETFFRVDEKSKDPNTDNLYYLKFNTFQNDTNTLQGTQLIQQDINLFENNPDYSVRFRFLQTKGFSQYASGNERGLNIQRSLRIKIGLSKDVGTQLDITNKTDRNIAPVNSIRNRNIISEGATLDFIYRPIQQIESGFAINFTKATDYYPSLPIDANINQQTLRFIYSFTSIGRVRIELERAEIILNENILTFPYELTNGRINGKSYFIRGIFDYSISQNIQASLNYDGRLEGSRRLLNTARAQVTAFF
ncbi:MAG TPA: hypothetical protein PLG90_01665 [Ignavibacteria bacterium]|nr:hypothetical protein [Ignavibacteria bacterium]